ncbi:MAG: DUF2971 domain-containing protein [Desulfobulbus sp.]|nr:DUF2971 domain-containing protein [Desulfobulbus sp.]
MGFKISNLEQRMQSFFREELPVSPGYKKGCTKAHYPDRDELKSWLDPVLNKLDDKNYIDVAKELSESSLLFKNPAFKEECEWRIVATPRRNPQSKYVWEIINEELSGSLKFRHTEKGLSSYFKLPIESCDITDIVLGPLNQSESIDVKAFLWSKLKKNIKVSRSAATYCG